MPERPSSGMQDPGPGKNRNKVRTNRNKTSAEMNPEVRDFSFYACFLAVAPVARELLLGSYRMRQFRRQAFRPKPEGGDHHSQYDDQEQYERNIRTAIPLM